MAKYLILHGTDATPHDNWFMWLKGVLVGKGHQVWLPQLPNAATPNQKVYTEFLLSNPKFTFDDQTVIIGHSSGAVEALYLLQHLPKNIQIKAAFLVSAFKNDLEWDALAGLFTETLDFEEIKHHCPDITFIHSDTDPYVPLEHAQYLAAQTNGRLIVYEGQGHFNTELSPDYKKFPELLDIVCYNQ